MIRYRSYREFDMVVACAPRPSLWISGTGVVKDVLTVEQLNYEYASSESLIVLDNTVAHTSVVIPGGSAPASVDMASSVVVGLQPEGADIIPGAKRPVRGLTTVQFHQVKHPKESYVVHLFVNCPDATVETPRKGNPNYAGPTPGFFFCQRSH